MPVYSPESITKVNQARLSQMEYANEQRKRLQTAYQNDINRLKKKIDDIHKKGILVMRSIMSMLFPPLLNFGC